MFAVAAVFAVAAPGAFAAAGNRPVPTPAAFESPAASPDGLASDSEIKTRLNQGNSLTIAGDRLHVALLRAFYAAHGNLPVWDNHAETAKALWAAVLRGGAQGLDPNMFHASALAYPAGLSPIDRELLLSDAFLGYADALSRGADPVEMRPGDQILSPGAVDVVAALNAAIDSPQPGTALDALAPGNPQYQRLRAAYQKYQAIAKAGGWPKVEAAGADERCRQLQQRLSVEGYLPAGYATGKFDETTTAALKAFQGRHGIEADGKLGPGTVAELNIGADARVQQIAVGLERIRWLPHALPATRVQVNTASMQLDYFKDEQPAFNGRVVVGQIDKQTPEFAATINSLLYNPPWNVPTDIAEKEILSKLDEEPDYLERHNMVMRDNGGVTQLPGAGTALGRLKFEMEDRFDVYLHDTPQRFLFARENRRLSHGCVRVQNPRDLASLLSGEPVEAINKGIATSATTRHSLPAPIPVFITYQTAYVGTDGQLQFRRDAYKRDDAVWRHLVPAGQTPVAGQDSGAQRKG
ncbi:MAG TPA: L,D-transpeptidase family protein [Stellaceae bacterium]|nr:L,D-transpeptidase family protein [Stellaceae bacterium]